MGTFFVSRRNQVIVAMVAVVMLVLLLLAAFNLGRGGPAKIGVSPAGGTSVLPSSSPSADATPSPAEPSPSPSPAARTPSAAAPAPAASAAVPGTTSPALTTAGHELDAPASPGPADRFGSGAPCYDTWADPGWTIDHTDCGIFAIRGPDQDGSVAFVVEHMGVAPNIKRRVYLMTGADAWHVRLTATDDTGTRYDMVQVKKATVAGDAYPEVVVGFRINGTGHFLTYDIVEMRALGGALEVAASRNLDHGSANIEASDIVDYTPYPNASTPDYFIRSVIGFSGGAFRINDSSHAPERGPGDLAPPP